MVECKFTLNDQPMSSLQLGATVVPAYSGLGKYVNRRAYACSPGMGPIPPGAYYILDRQSGGRLNSIRSFFHNKDSWFALYAVDGRVDDETFCDGIERGNFRLHPRGFTGRSEGCVVIDRVSDFQRLRAILKSIVPTIVVGTRFRAYGRLIVR